MNFLASSHKLCLATYLIIFLFVRQSLNGKSCYNGETNMSIRHAAYLHQVRYVFTKTETQFSHQVSMEFPIKRNNQTVICSIPSLINIISSLVQGTIEFVFYLSESLQCVKIFSLITRSRNYFHTRKLSHQRI